MSQKGILIESGKEKYVVLGWNLSPIYFQPPSACKLEIRPKYYDFGKILNGTCSPEAIFSLENIGQDFAVVDISLIGPDSSNFTITAGGGSHILNQSFNISIHVRFCPESLGDKTARLYVESSGCDDTYANLFGKSISPSHGGRPPGPGEEPVENKWFVATRYWEGASYILLCHCPCCKTQGVVNTHEVYFDPWGVMWIRASSGGGELHYYDFVDGCLESWLEFYTYDLTPPSFTLGPVSGSRMYIFGPGGSHGWKIVIAEVEYNSEWPYFSLIDKNVYDLEVLPPEVYYDGYNNWCLCGTWNYSPYNIKTVDIFGNIHAETQAPHGVSYCAIDDCNHYWFIRHEANEIYIYTSNLDHIRTINLPSEVCLSGISESSNYDILAVDYDNMVGYIFYSDEDYSLAHEFSFASLGFRPSKVGTWHGDWVLVCGPDGVIGLNLKTLESHQVSETGALGIGDIGFRKWATWGWPWQPNIEKLSDWLAKRC